MKNKVEYNNSVIYEIEVEEKPVLVINCNNEVAIILIDWGKTTGAEIQVQKVGTTDSALLLHGEIKVNWNYLDSLDKYEILIYIELLGTKHVLTFHPDNNSEPVGLFNSLNRIYKFNFN